MLTLSIKHPDAERFIDAKVDTSKVTGANVSVKIDDEFMRAALAGKKYHQQFPIHSDKPLYQQDIDAKKLWDKIIHNAWKSAEPGVMFWDTIIRESIPDCYADEGFTTVATNPCGEIPLCPYDSCRLLAINLLSYVDKPFTKEASFNFEKFKQHVEKAMRMMDDIIDLELEKIELIINKIAADPEDEDIRRVELELWKDPHDGPQRTSYGTGHHGRRRHARSIGTPLRYARSDGFRREGTEDPRTGSLPRLGKDGRRARSVRNFRCTQGGEEPDDRPHPGGRSGASTPKW